MRIFDVDSPLMRVLGRMADLLLLNILTIICCIPIVTAGASLTALHYMALKIVRNEESYIIRGFFKSFKQNLKQATIIWLLLLLTIALIMGDLYLLNGIEIPFGDVLKVIVLAVGIIVSMVAAFIFPVLAKFDNTVIRTIKNALIISIMQLPKTIAMLVLNWLPWVLLFVNLQIIPLSFLFGFVIPAYLSAFMYNKFFKKLEEQIMEANGNNVSDEEDAEDERIFRDHEEEVASEKRKSRWF